MTRLAESSGLRLHMAGLAQADQILPSVRFRDAGAVAERLGVVDREAGPDILAAVGAVPTLLAHDSKADTLPVPPTVTHWPAYPVRRPWARQILFPPFVPASQGAEVAGLLPAKLPGLAVERTSAVLARQMDRRHPLVVGWARSARRTGVFLRGATGRIQVGDLLDALAAPRTEACPVNVRRGASHDHSADLARDRDETALRAAHPLAGLRKERLSASGAGSRLISGGPSAAPSTTQMHAIRRAVRFRPRIELIAQRLIALVCHEKRPIPTRREAERLADSHSDCPKCQAGGVMREYVCATNPTHWHIGHAPR